MKMMMKKQMIMRQDVLGEHEARVRRSAGCKTGQLLLKYYGVKKNTVETERKKVPNCG